jgi:hypothetical protein
MKGEKQTESSEKELEKLEVEKTWRNLFLAVTEMAKEANLPVNAVQAYGRFRETKNKEFNYELRVNPAILSEDNKLEVLVVDVLYKGIPTQQWVAKAEWTNDVPKLKAMDMSLLNNLGTWFETDEIAVYAEGIVKEKIRLRNESLEKGKINTLMSDNYSNTLN